MLHKNVLPGDNHPIYNWEVANDAALAALSVTAADVGKVAFKLDDKSFHVLTDESPVTWFELGTGGGGSLPAGGTAGQVLTKIDGTDGNANWQTPATGGGSHVAAHRNGVDQTGVVSGTPTKVLFTTEQYDTDSEFSTVNSRHTPTVEGVYTYATAAYFTTMAATSLVEIYIYKNGASYKGISVRSPGTAGMSVHISSPVYMNGTTDYVEIFVNHTSGSNRTLTGATESTWLNITN